MVIKDKKAEREYQREYHNEKYRNDVDFREKTKSINRKCSEKRRLKGIAWSQLHKGEAKWYLKGWRAGFKRARVFCCEKCKETLTKEVWYYQGRATKQESIKCEEIQVQVPEKCEEIQVPEGCCYVRFCEKREDHDYGYTYSNDEFGTVRGEDMIMDLNKQGRVIGIELLSLKKPCQSTIYKGGEKAC